MFEDRSRGVSSTRMHVFYEHGGIKMTALQVASYYGNLEVVKSLLAQGLDIEERDEDEDIERLVVPCSWDMLLCTCKHTIYTT